MISQNALLTYHIYQGIWQQIQDEKAESCMVNYHVLFWGQRTELLYIKNSILNNVLRCFTIGSQFLSQIKK